MPLTPEEQAELQQLKANQAARQQQSAQGGGLTPEEAQELAELKARQPQAAANAGKKGVLWPVSRDQQGNLQFDSDAGVVGMAKRALTLPYDVYRGNVQMTDPTTGRTSDQAIGRSMEAATVLSPVTPSMRSGGMAVGAANPTRPQQTPTPSPEELMAAGRAGRNAMKASGATYPTGAMQKFPDFVAARMRQNNRMFTPDQSPKTFALLERLRTPTPGAQYSSIDDLLTLRQTLGDLTKNPDERAAAVAAIKSLDEFIRRSGDMAPPSGPTPAAVRGRGVGSTPQARKIAADLLDEQNANFAAGYRGRLLDDIDYEATLQSAGANSGKNVGNTYRQKVKAALIKDRKKGRERTTDLTGFSPAEKKMLESIVEGSRSANVTRDIGNLLGGGGGLGQYVTGGFGAAGGAALGGPTGAAIGALAPVAAGKAVKGVSNRLSQRAFDEARNRVLQRSPLYQKRAAKPLPKASRSRSTEALIRALIAGQIDEGDL